MISQFHPRVVNAGDHLVQFYDEDQTLCAAIVQYLADGFWAGQPGIVIATPARRQRIADGLSGRGLDVAALRMGGQLAMLDAATTLHGVLHSNSPDPLAFAAVVGGAVRRAQSVRPSAIVRAYGEMVDLLWARGRPGTAMDLEARWDELLRAQRLSLLCAYALHHFQDVPTAPGLEDVCRCHTHVRLPITS